MANLFYVIGKRILVSKSRETVRGSVIFVLTHLLFVIGVVFAAEILLLLLGTADIHVPLAGKIIGLMQR